MASVIRPTIAGLKADGIDFRGTLYGPYVDEKGIKVPSTMSALVTQNTGSTTTH